MLTRKDAPFDWIPACETALNQLKHYLTSAPLLLFPKFDRELLLETNVSGLVLAWCRSCPEAT